LPEKVIDVYTKIGHLLSRYKSGPLPKPFKIIPTLPLPTQAAIVPITRPDTWTPHAVYAATRIFISSGGPIAQHFLVEVLLDRVRDDIRESVGQRRRLNVHLYAALRKSLYRPEAFFKGVLFPLLQSGSASMREAAIISSVIAKAHVPVLHSAAAITRCCDIAADQMLVGSGRHDLEAAGAANIVIKVLLEKKYALPFQTIDALVFHFLRFRPALAVRKGNGEEAVLPVIWHQCLLAFAERYKNEIAEEQREALLDLLLVRGHHAIGPEIRRELLAGRGKGLVEEPEISVRERMIDGDDTLMAMAA
jgi:essential nuclear protein 1